MADPGGLDNLDFYFSDPGGLQDFGATQPLSVQMDAAAVAAAPGAPSGPDVYSYGPSSNLAAAADAIRGDAQLNEVLVNDDGVLVDPSGKPLEPSVLEDVGRRLLEISKGTVNVVNGALRTPLGAAATTLGLGALGQAIGRSVAGSPRSLVLPPPTAGQNPALVLGNELTTAALSDPSARSNFTLAIQRALESQTSASGVINQALRQEAAAGQAIGPQSTAIRTLAVNELPQFLVSPGDVAKFENLAGQFGPEVTRTLASRTAYPEDPAVTARLDALAGKTQIANWIRRIESDTAAGNPWAPSTITNKFMEEGIAASDAQALAQRVSDRINGTGPIIAPNPLDASLQAKAKSLVTGSPTDFALPVDPVERSMQARLLRAIEGGETDPATERAIAEGLEILRNKLKAAYGTTGAEWDSTLGQNLYLKGLESAAATRYGINRDVINSIGPQQAGRRTFQITNPQQMYLNEAGLFVPAAERSTEFNQQARAQNEALRLQALQLLSGTYSGALRDAANLKASGANERMSLATFNPVNLGVVGAGASTGANIANIPTLSNVNDAASRLSIDQARNQATLAGFNADVAARAAQAQGVAGLFGTAAAEAIRAGRPTFGLRLDERVQGEG